jgi:hypothetical protein
MKRAPVENPCSPFVSWECRELVIDEFDFIQLGDDDPVCGAFHRSVHKSLGPAADTSLDPGQVHQVWRGILKRFSEASLSFQSDRLKAISGIISGIYTRTSWDNMSGLWAPFIVRELLWETYWSGAHTGLRPSWSWISVDGQVLGVLWAGRGRTWSWQKSTSSASTARLRPLRSLKCFCIPLRVEMGEEDMVDDWKYSCCFLAHRCGKTLNPSPRSKTSGFGPTYVKRL